MEPIGTVLHSLKKKTGTRTPSKMNTWVVFYYVKQNMAEPMRFRFGRKHSEISQYHWFSHVWSSFVSRSKIHLGYSQYYDSYLRREIFVEREVIPGVLGLREVSQICLQGKPHEQIQEFLLEWEIEQTSPGYEVLSELEVVVVEGDFISAEGEEHRILVNNSIRLITHISTYLSRRMVQFWLNLINT
jgi:hypothetical protein